MNCLQNINNQEYSPDQQTIENEISSPIVPLILHEPYIENVQLSPLPCFSHVGAESFDWVLSYSDDIFMHWQRVERDCMKVNGYQNMAEIRPLLIDILRDLQENYELANTTLHLAVYVLDHFLSRHSVKIPLKFVVITSLLVAAKVEDVDTRIPRFIEINRTMLNNTFSLKDYRKLEVKMLVCVDFGLTVPTVATFGDYFSRISVVLDDFYIYQQVFDKTTSIQIPDCSPVPDERMMYGVFRRYDEMLTAVNELLQHLIDLTLDIVALLNVLPSRKAAACMAAARLLNNVQPVWTPFLEMQSCYSEEDIRPVMDIVISIYNERVSKAKTCGSSPENNNNNDTSNIDGSPFRDVTNAYLQNCPDSDN